MPETARKRHENDAFDKLRLEDREATTDGPIRVAQAASAATGIDVTVTTPGGAVATWGSVRNNSSGFFTMDTDTPSVAGPFTDSASVFGISTGSLATTGGFSASDAYDMAFLVAVDGVTFNDPDGVVDLTGTTVTAPFNQLVTLSGLEVEVQFFFSPDRPTVRALYSFENPTGSPITATIAIGHEYGSDAFTQIDATSSGDTVLDPGDNWIVTSDGPPFGDPVLVTTRFGDGTSVTPVNIATPGATAPNNNITEGLVEEYTITVPANATSRLLIFGEMHPSVVSAQTAAADLESASALRSTTLLDGLTDDQLSEVVNYDFAPVGVPAEVPTVGTVGTLLFAGALAVTAVVKLVSPK